MRARPRPETRASAIPPASRIAALLPGRTLLAGGVIRTGQFSVVAARSVCRSEQAWPSRSRPGCRPARAAGSPSGPGPPLPHYVIAARAPFGTNPPWPRCEAVTCRNSIAAIARQQHRAPAPQSHTTPARSIQHDAHDARTASSCRTPGHTPLRTASQPSNRSPARASLAWHHSPEVSTSERPKRSSGSLCGRAAALDESAVGGSCFMVHGPPCRPLINAVPLQPWPLLRRRCESWPQPQRHRRRPWRLLLYRLPRRRKHNSIAPARWTARRCCRPCCRA